MTCEGPGQVWWDDIRGKWSGWSQAHWPSGCHRVIRGRAGMVRPLSVASSLSLLTLRDYNYPGHRTGTLQCCRQAADDKSDLTQWGSLLCSVSGYVTHNWASQDPGHYGDITMPWHSYSGHPGTFYLSWITCSCVTCDPLYPVLTLAPWDAGAALNSCQGGLVWVDPAQSWTDKEKMMHGQDQDRGAVKTSRARCHIPSHS